jgi:beta-mannanase
VDIRLFHEMNGDWMPWGVGKSGASNQDIINAWRHVHDIFVEEGATNARFVFCPNERYTIWQDSHPYADYYPGDAYVDYLALDGYNWGDARGLPWYSFDEIFDQSYQELTALSSTKPVMIAEYASHTSPGDKAQWITDAQNVLKSGKYSRIKALLWFEDNQEGAKWRIDTSQSSIDAYKALAADPYFQPS